MTRRTKWLRWSAVMLLVPALAASMPSIQFCMLTADGSARARFAGCLEPGMLGAAIAAETPAPAAVPTHAPAPSSSTASACGGGSCPLASRDHAACAATCAVATRAAASPARSQPRSRNVLLYCLGDPAAGRALRSHTPLIAMPGPLVAWLAFAATVAPDDAPAQTTWPERLATARSRLATARPPVRAPPSQV